ncbi:MAG TPA: hypothetical protein VG435_16715 [Acidimicrobiales bacterium]|jgi:hypothetical protein|nr:hypothetical protein [Acidimicrobiales bacterium]
MPAPDHAPDALAAWNDLLGAVAAALPADRFEAARSIARGGLDPGHPPVPRSAEVAFAEQMVVDVASLTPAQRRAALAELGATAPVFVLAVWTEDMAVRADHAFRQILGAGLPERTAPVRPAEPWAAHERFLREVAKLDALDPVTAELVRLRGARAHACRLCQSRRNVTAIDLAGNEELFDQPEPTELSAAQHLALDVVDAFVWQPLRWPAGLGARIAGQLGPAAATELVLDIVRNAANKIAVAFGADAPQVETGVEYYEIDGATGDLRYGVLPAGRRV